ncbi:MAG: phosphate ABC transporter ATP-binding protein PstB [Gemmatimonadota bacterium]|jgi:phosphate transport system ATP-binding protein
MASTYGIDLEGAVPALEARDVSVTFGSRHVVKRVSLMIPPKRVVALVGPSGCGKSTLLKCFNRMNDLNPEARVTGGILFFGQDIYAPGVDPTGVRRQIGMVFQTPNPFPKTIFENVAFGPMVNAQEGDLSRTVEEALKKAALWDEVSDQLAAPALTLSNGQQQRLCIARALAVDPEILLMDEPMSELDPLAVQRIEELVRTLKKSYTIVLVTHNLQQAARISDFTAFMYGGELLEYGPTATLFTNPREEKTERYITGRFG